MSLKVNLRWACLTAAAALLASGPAARAQDDVLVPDGPAERTIRELADGDKEVIVKFVTSDDAETPKPGATKADTEYWIGLQVTIVPELVRSQLGTDHGLAVGEIVPDSPAAKAGVQKHDILLKANGQSLSDMHDLLKAVESSAGRPMSLVLLRQGKEQTVEVTAEKRPAELRVTRFYDTPELASELRRVEEALKSLKAKTGDGKLELYFPRPGVVAPRAEINRIWSKWTDADGKPQDFPKDLEVRVTKAGSEPAKIHVRRGEQKWDVTESELDKLPDDIRPHVKRYVGQADAMKGPLLMTKEDRKILLTPDGKVQGELHVKPLPPLHAPGEKSARAAVSIKTDAKSASQLEAILSEIRELRKDVEELKKNK